MFTRISSFVRIGAGSRALTTHSKRSNGISPSIFPYGRRLSEKCAGSNYCYNDNQITSAHQNYRSTEMLVYRKNDRHIFTTHIQAGSEWISRTYPRLFPRDVKGPRRTTTPDSCSTSTRTQRRLTLTNMPHYFLPQMGGRRIVSVKWSLHTLFTSK
jgi:hypothetical protein